MMRKQEAPRRHVSTSYICKRRNRRSVAGPLISNGHCGVCSAKSKVAGSTPRCVVGLLKGGGSRPREGYPTVCGSVDAIAEHKHIYEAACVDTNPDVEND